ncbi:hypothetical protein Cycma_5002 [Cyclobacterium marinum DSM 745]|uniref:Uncharacterized protein n=1 Tax=Cyclobacterium marinum (strain ATCC 25205 / DSM 745 / LMG 13164 / NCIMB 1802) TaxID=880070 RepID=G0J817_CYCMS|nr:hypothetical protein Cycma_5002 [Cyclobacterium marinum DSM 745]
MLKNLKERFLFILYKTWHLLIYLSESFDFNKDNRNLELFIMLDDI